MQTEQDKSLRPVMDANGWSCTWHSGLDEVQPDENAYTMILAHEFFDALPIHLLKVLSPHCGHRTLKWNVG